MAAVATPSQGPRPRLRRHPEGGLLAGVCAGIGARAGIDPLILRVVFFATALAGGVGLAVYALAWLLLPATDAGGAPAARLRTRPGSFQIAAGVGLLALAALLTFRGLGLWFSDAIVWPTVLAAAGGALLWRQSTQRAGAPLAPAADPADGPVAGGRPFPLPVPELYRGGFGVALVLGAGLLALQLGGALEGARDALVTVVVVVAALALILAPYVWRLARNLTAERAERIRSQERAEMAAHLHDSVLQTLALMQRSAQDPRAVATLARRQERELRAWLSGGSAAATEKTFGAALAAAAAGVEEDLGVPIEVVTVGDAALDPHVEALVAAAREAMLNAGKFAGHADVYAEAGEAGITVFVRDRGAGFDPESVSHERRGLRESVVGRMHRHGGTATINAAPGVGTEIELGLPR